MKQPDLEEEALRLRLHSRDITIQRQTMADTVNQVTLTSPTGKTGRLNSQKSSLDCGARRPRPMNSASGVRPTAS